MTFAEFVKELHPLIQYFGTDHFPKVVLERIHYKLKDLNRSQLVEVRNLILDSCEFAPKVPKFIEYANLVRAKHREPVNQVTNTEIDRTSEVATEAIAQIRSIFSKTKVP